VIAPRRFKKAMWGGKSRQQKAWCSGVTPGASNRQLEQQRRESSFVPQGTTADEMKRAILPAATVNLSRL